MMIDDGHVAEDGHRCCVMTIMQDDVHVVTDGHRFLKIVTDCFRM